MKENGVLCCAVYTVQMDFTNLICVSIYHIYLGIESYNYNKNKKTLIFYIIIHYMEGPIDGIGRILRKNHIEVILGTQRKINNISYK